MPADSPPRPPSLREGGAASTGGITGWLARAPQGVLAAYAIVASFSTYFCMYFYRRTFAAGTFADLAIFGLDAKSVFVISQVVGYAASKFLGIKVVSELEPSKRARAILVSIGISELALVLFAVSPPKVAFVAMAANGLSLGMIWGMVFGFLEGRRTSDLLGAALCVSFIVGSGAAKSAGKMLLDAGVSERWMPAVTGVGVAPFLVFFVFLLSRIPPPTETDEALRTERTPMDARARRAFFARYAPGLVLLIAAYVLLTALRDFRDNFAREIWDGLGYGSQPSILATAEIPVAIGSILGVAAIGIFRSNRVAVLATHGLLLLGPVLVIGSTALFHAGMFGPVAWMIGLGLGLYVAYVPYNCVLFDRLVAASGSAANAGFLIYVADASGYAGSVALLIYKNVGHATLSWVSFLKVSGAAAGAFVALAVVASAIYFRRALRPEVAG